MKVIITFLLLLLCR